MANFWLHLLALYVVFTTVYSEPFIVVPAIGIGVVGVAAAIYAAAKCRFTECCTERWITPNITGLHHDLNHRVFGQHLVTNIVFKAVKGHLNNQSPQKALALSFNGWTGCGKNFVSKIVAENLFTKGMDSKYVSLIIATHHFPHKSELENYKTLLKSWVIGNITKCPRSLFIFDEMDKMPVGLVDVLKPFLDHYPEVEGVNCRKAMFLFLSNTGAKLINSEVLDNWRRGNDRSHITIKQMDNIINYGAFNEKQQGFWHTSLIEQHLIDYFVPFLPLERVHVKMCAKVDLKAKKHFIDDDVLNRIADEMLYFPDDTKVFSKSGCKKVSSKVDIVLG